MQSLKNTPYLPCSLPYFAAVYAFALAFENFVMLSTSRSGHGYMNIPRLLGSKRHYLMPENWVLITKPLLHYHDLSQCLNH